VERTKHIGEHVARKDLGTPRSKPGWLENQHSLPFQFLSPDEFEIFCYLLLLRENPEENICYYGKTGDAGRDIIRYRRDCSVDLIQCKRYQNNVGLPEIKTELAKLFVNLDNKTIAEQPNKVIFYVVPDLTAPAQDLIDHRSKWFEIAESAIKKYLKQEPTQELLQFAKSWCPQLQKETAINLTERARKHAGLIEEFFSYKKVIPSNGPQLNVLIKQNEQILQRLLYLQAPEIAKAPDYIQDFLSHEFLTKSEQENPGLSFTMQRSTQETVLIIQSKPGGGSGTYGTLSFPNTAAGRQGQQKFKIFEEQGRDIRLELGEYEWTWAPTLSLLEMQGELEIRAVPQPEISVSLECLQDGEVVASVEFTNFRFVRLGTHEIEFCVKGGHLAGLITAVVSFQNKPLTFNLAANLGCVKPDKAKRTLQLLLALLHGGKLQIKSLASDAPLSIGSIVNNIHLREEQLEEYIRLLDYLIKINREFGFDLRYPKIFDVDAENTARLIVSAIEHGQVEYSRGIVRFNDRRQDALELIKRLRIGEPLQLAVDEERNYQLLGQALPMGKSRIVFQNIFPIDGLPALEQAVQDLGESDKLQIALQYDRAIESFLRWLPETTQETDGNHSSVFG
jgi:hypothetical protein